jgi:hypothetical protein
MEKISQGQVIGIRFFLNYIYRFIYKIIILSKNSNKNVFVFLNYLLKNFGTFFNIKRGNLIKQAKP